METRRKFMKLLSVAPLAFKMGSPLLASAQSPAEAASSPVACPLAPGALEGSPEGDTLLPGQNWKAHDRKRPQARKVNPGPYTQMQPPPSDAIVLFNGKDLS